MTCHVTWQDNPLRVTLPYMKKDNIVIKPTTDILIINSYGLTISIKTTPVSSKIKKLTAACHGASCMQANGAEGRKNDRLKKEERERRKDLTRVNTTIYRKKGGSCLNCKANNLAWTTRPTM